MSGDRPERGSIPRAAAALFFSVGCYTILMQVALLRECFALFSGNELSVAVQLALWLCFTAAGGAIGSMLSRRSFGTLLAIVPVGGMWSVTLVRLLPVWFPIPLGQELPVGWAVLALAVAQAPLNLAAGALFPVSCRFFAEEDEGRAIGWFYALDALGAFVAGTAFTLLLAGRAHALEVVLWASAGLSAAAAVVMWRRCARARLAAAGLAVALLVLALSGRFARTVDDLWWRSRHPGSTHVLSFETRYERIDVGRREGQHTVYCNGLPALALEDTEEPTSGYRSADLYLALHPDPRRVLVLGLGEEGLLRRILEYPVEEVIYCLPDPAMLEVASLTAGAVGGGKALSLGDARLTVFPGDALTCLRRPGQFDLILLDLPAPTTAAGNRFFTLQTFRLARERLREGGVLVFQLPSSAHYIPGETQMLLASIHKALVAAFGRAEVIASDRMIFVGGLPGEVAAVQELAERFAGRGVPVRLSSGRTVEDPEQKRAAFLALYETEFDEFRQRQQVEALLSTPAPTNEDTRPVAYYLNLRRWVREAGLSPKATESVFSGTEAVVAFCRTFWAPLVLAAALLLPAVVALSAGGRRKPGARRGALAIAVLVSGWAGMLGELAIVFMYQNEFGQIYYAMGALLATYMLALVAASTLTSSLRLGPAGRVRCILMTRVLMIASCVAAGGALSAFPSPAIYFAALFVYAFALGMEYPVANRMYREDEGGTHAAGVLHAMDHLGGGAAALLGGTIVLPLVGPRPALVAVACLHVVTLVTLLALLATRRHSERPQ